MTTHRPLSILLVTQFAPPAGFSATRRAAGLAKYLGRLGHEVTVLTSLASGRGPMTEAARVVRTRDLTASGLNWRRQHFESARGDGAPGGYEGRPSRLAQVIVPDLSLIAWVPFALPRALALERRLGFDCVITSSPPESVHLVGLCLKRLRGVPWIADLKDGWTFEATRPAWPLGVQRRLDRSLEQSVARQADLVTTVTDPITDDLRERTGTTVKTLTNGFDPDERVHATKSECGLRDDRFSLVYTGRLAFARSTPAPLLDAIRELIRSRPELAQRLEVVFAGPLTEAERAAMAAPDLDGIVRSLGNLDRSKALALQSAADALLLVIPPARPRSVATAKLYEYLLAGPPILVLGQGNAAADIVSGTGSGTVTSADDAREIATAVAGVIDDHGDTRSANGRTDDVDRYSYPSIAERLSAEIAAVASRRS